MIEFDPVGFGKPLEDGMDVAHLRFHATGPQPEVDMKAVAPVEIAFGERRLRAKALPSVRREVEVVVRAFEQDFP
jgi:hypothetical protein